jgi:hypothetical protein
VHPASSVDRGNTHVKFVVKEKVLYDYFEVQWIKVAKQDVTRQNHDMKHHEEKLQPLQCLQVRWVTKGTSGWIEPGRLVEE